MKKHSMSKGSKGVSDAKMGPQRTNTGSGSRPNAKPRTMTPTSEPKDMHGLGGRNKVKHAPLK